LISQASDRAALLETVRELKLRREEAKMAAIAKQIQIKRLRSPSAAKREALETANRMIAARRKLIREAILQQREVNLRPISWLGRC